MAAEPHLRIAVVALHTSPYGAPGSGDVGGMNVLIHATADRMAELGHYVEVVTRRFSAELPTVERLPSGVVTRYVDAGPAELRPKAEHEAFVEEFRDGLDALGEFDIIHSHHWLSGMAALPFAEARRIPHVQSFHSIAADAKTRLAEGERPESPGRMGGEAWLAKNSDAIVAVSHAEEKTILDRLGADRRRVSVVLPGVDAEMFHPSTRADAPRYVVAAARIEPLKGLDLAISTIAQIDDEHRPDLVIAGGPTGGYEWYLDELHALVRDLQVSDRVRFAGPKSREELAELLSHASAVLIPSHSETYGLVALEAAASGVPVLAAPAGGLCEAVNDRTGIIAESRDPAVWAEHLVRLLTDAAYADRLAVTARGFAETRSWARTTDETLAVYTTLLAGHDLAGHGLAGGAAPGNNAACAAR
jgi:D-inositol-3-phosphate glycosyltransferase